MFGPEWREGCPSARWWPITWTAASSHSPQRDVTLAVVSRAHQAPIDAFRERMGVRFKWVSSSETISTVTTASPHAGGEAEGRCATTRLHDFPSEEAHGASVFHKDGSGEISTPTPVRARRRGAARGSTAISISRQKARRGKAFIPHGLDPPSRPLRRGAGPPVRAGEKPR